MATVTMTSSARQPALAGWWLRGLVLVVLSVLAAFAQAQDAVTLNSIGFANLPGDSIEVRLEFDGIPPEPTGFTQTDPARISIDLSNVQSSLAERRFDLGASNAQSVMVLETSDRTRLVFNLVSPVEYQTRIEGNTLVVHLGGDNVVAAAPAETVEAQVVQEPASDGPAIADVAFRRGNDLNEGQIVITLSDDQIVGNVEQVGSRVYLEFAGTAVPERLNRRFDVTDFATPVNTVDVYPQRGNATIAIDLNGQYEYVAYQQGRQYTVSVTPPGSAAANADPASQFSGSLVSLSFQNIDVRSVLQLQDVPWDQALNLVLQSRNLDKRLVGNVLYVAPANEIAAQEQQALDASRQASGTSRKSWMKCASCSASSTCRYGRS